MTPDDLKEQLQQDMLAYLEGMDQSILDQVCSIIVDRVNEYKDSNNNERLALIAWNPMRG